MFAQLFGEYLVKHSVIKEDIFRQIIDKQLSVRVRLGTIAIAEGFMTEEQVEEVNHLQRAKDKRFGDIAVEQGYLTQEQMELLLSKQGDSYLQFVQLMTELAGLTQTDVEQLVQSFGKDSGFSREELEAIRNDDIDRLIPLYIISSKPYIRDITALVAKNVLRFVTRDFYFDRVQRLQEFSYEHLSCQEIGGDDALHVAIAEETDEGGFLKVARSFSGQEMNSAPESYDAMGEFINVINGLFVTEQSMRGVNLDMEPPVSYRKQKTTGDFYMVPFYIEGKRIVLILSVNSAFSAGETPEELKAISKGTAKAASKSLGKGRILIVDDSVMSRTILRNILTKAGYEVAGEAADGEEGVRLYEELKPDLVTLDITMPRVDGLEALTRILALDPEATAIMITAAGQQEKLIKAIKTGAKRFINKPFKEEEILRNIEEIT